MPRILIVNDAIARPSYAPRMRYLCDHLSQLGWEVTLCSEYFEDVDFERNFDLRLVPLYRTQRRSKLRYAEWFTTLVLNLLFDYKEHRFRRKLEQMFAGQDFDMVCCSTFATFPLRACHDFARRRGIPFHVDLRDIAEQTDLLEYSMHKTNRCLARFITRRYIKARNAVLKTAQSITTITPWQVMVLGKVNPLTRLIYNGYDATRFFPADVHSDVFSILYTGKLFSNYMQDPRALFEAVSNMHHRGEIDRSWFRLDFYVSPAVQLRLMGDADTYGIQDYFFFHRYVEPNLVPQLMHHSSVSLVLANKCSDHGPNGILPTKLFEAIGVEKPILCTKDDESVIADVVRLTNSGISTSDIGEIEAFLRHQIAQWRTNGFTRQPVNPEQKILFSRQYQAEQFRQIFEGLMGRDK